MNEKKKNIPLMIALSIPVLMIALITVGIYVPTLLVNPTQDFIYSNGRMYCHGKVFIVEKGKVIRKQSEEKKDQDTCPGRDEHRLFYYDVEKDTSREISFTEAQTYDLDTRYKSQDGFEIVSGNRSFDLFGFGGSSYYDRYIKKDAFSRKIALQNDYYNHYNFRFLGWVKEVENE